jgi:hypothetical protein
MENIVKENSIINISLDKAYNNQEDFWTDNQALVYSKIIEIYSKFIDSEEQSLGMTVAVKIYDDEQKIYFGFDKDYPEILIDLLMPYYIECEEYEICAILRDMYQSLVVIIYNKNLENK